jgi:hypothetical protein
MPSNNAASSEVFQFVCSPRSNPLCIGQAAPNRSSAVEEEPQPSHGRLNLGHR